MRRFSDILLDPEIMTEDLVSMHALNCHYLGLTYLCIDLTERAS